MSHASPFPFAPCLAIDGTEILLTHPAARYASTPPGLIEFRPAANPTTRAFLAFLARPHVTCAPEHVLRYRNAHVLDGRHVVAACGTAVEESFAYVDRNAARSALELTQRARIQAGDADHLPEAGPQAVAIFKAHDENFGHVLMEVLPRLLHLETLGIRRIRLLLPDAAAPLRPMIEFTLRTLGLAADLVPCPPGSVLRVADLLWVSPVSQLPERKSPTGLRLLHRLRDASPPPTGPSRLFILRPPTGLRVVENAAELADIARHFGYTPIEPSTLPFPDQVSLFAGARRVAGPWGAGLTLAAAMYPGGALGELNPGILDPFFWDQACLANLSFDWAITAHVTTLHNGERWVRPNRFDPATLRRLLTTLEARTIP